MLRGSNVLVVEDEYYLAFDLRDALEVEGVRVLGPYAHFIEIDQPFYLIDCAILDINLQGEKVWTLALQLKRLEIPFLFLTGYDREVIVPTIFKDIPLLTKPVDMDELFNELHKMIKREPVT